MVRLTRPRVGRSFVCGGSFSDANPPLTPPYKGGELWSRRSEKFYEVGHLFGSDLLFEAFGHQRFSGSSEGFNLAAKKRRLRTLLTHDCDGIASFFHKNSVFHDAVGGDGHVLGKLLVDRAIRIEDFAQEAVVRFILTGRNARADFRANISKSMAD